MRLYRFLIKISVAVSLVSLFLLNGSEIGSQTTPQGITSDDIVKHIVRQITYATAHRRDLGVPSLVLDLIELDLIEVATEDAGGGVSFKILLFEAEGNLKKTSGATKTTHVKLTAQEPTTFDDKNLAPGDSFLFDRLLRWKKSITNSGILQAEEIKFTEEFVVKNVVDGTGAIKGLSFIPLLEVGGNIDRSALKQRTQSVTYTLKKIPAGGGGGGKPHFN